MTDAAGAHRPVSAINTEFDSRILRVSSGAAGITRPQIGRTGTLERVYCLHCGKDGGAVSAVIPAAIRGDPGVIYVCNDCDGTFGELPTHATSLIRYAG